MVGLVGRARERGNTKGHKRRFEEWTGKRRLEEEIRREAGGIENPRKFWREKEG